MLDVNERIEADQREFEGLRNAFGDATGRYPISKDGLGDSGVTDLGIVYAGIRHNRDAQVAAKRLAFNYLLKHDFDSAQKILEKLDYSPKEIIRDLENMYTFTGLEKYREMKRFYGFHARSFVEKESERKKDILLEHYIEAVKNIRRTQSKLEKQLKKRNKYLELIKGHGVVSNREWMDDIIALEKEISSERAEIGMDCSINEDSVKEDIGRIERLLLSAESKFIKETTCYRNIKSGIERELECDFGGFLEKISKNK